MTEAKAAELSDVNVVSRGALTLKGKGAVAVVEVAPGEVFATIA